MCIASYYDYEPTSDEIKDFRIDKLAYSKPVERVKTPRPTHGSLIYVEGANRTVIKNDLPFALLQSIKRQMVNNGYKEKKFKIEYKK